jgi:hypothetical protein
MGMNAARWAENYSAESAATGRQTQLSAVFLAWFVGVASRRYALGTVL